MAKSLLKAKPSVPINFDESDGTQCTTWLANGKFGVWALDRHTQGTNSWLEITLQNLRAYWWTYWYFTFNQ